MKKIQRNIRFDSVSHKSKVQIMEPFISKKSAEQKNRTSFGKMINFSVPRNRSTCARETSRYNHWSRVSPAIVSHCIPNCRISREIRIVSIIRTKENNKMCGKNYAKQTNPNNGRLMSWRIGIDSQHVLMPQLWVHNKDVCAHMYRLVRHIDSMVLMSAKRIVW